MSTRTKKIVQGFISSVVTTHRIRFDQDKDHVRQVDQTSHHWRSTHWRPNIHVEIAIATKDNHDPNGISFTGIWGDYAERRVDMRKDSPIEDGPSTLHTVLWISKAASRRGYTHCIQSPERNKEADKVNTIRWSTFPQVNDQNTRRLIPYSKMIL